MPTLTEPVLSIRATWDDEANVWVAESTDVPGLSTEADTLDGLLAKLRDILPELLELNDRRLPAEVPFELLTRQSTASRSSRR